MNYIYKVLGINWFKHTLAWPKGSFVPCNKAKDQLPLFSIADDSLFCWVVDLNWRLHCVWKRVFHM